MSTWKECLYPFLHRIFLASAPHNEPSFEQNALIFRTANQKQFLWDLTTMMMILMMSERSLCSRECLSSYRLISSLSPNASCRQKGRSSVSTSRLCLDLQKRGTMIGARDLGHKGWVLLFLSWLENLQQIWNCWQIPLSSSLHLSTGTWSLVDGNRGPMCDQCHCSLWTSYIW